MSEPDPYRALLAAEVACALGRVDADAAARALQAAWEEGPAGVAEVLDALVVGEGLPPEERGRIEAEVERRLAQAGGNPRSALASEGTAPAALRRSLAGGPPALSMALTRVLEPNGPRLRPMVEGRYTEFSPVGEGGMGIVYWALDTELSRQVAIKIVRPPTPGAAREGVTPSAPVALSPPKAGSDEADLFEGLRLRFLQEAWVTGGMEHPGIVPVYELGRTPEGVPYYTMRFIRGSRTLRTAIEEHALDTTPERIQHLLEPFLKVCDTIRYAHSRGVIHRDLKPDNVALGEYGEVVVLDWGLARVKGGLDETEDPWAGRVQDLRRAGDLRTVAAAVGTPGYLSPEAAQGRIDEVDERSDVFALGVMLFQILTGRLPHEFLTSDEYAKGVVESDAPDARSITPDAPRRLADLCARALARDRVLRPASADALAEEIRTWRAEAAKDREIEVRIAEANAALAAAADHSGDEMLRELDRAAAAGRRVLELDPGHQEGIALLERAAERRERGIQQRERGARLRTLKRVAVAVTVVGIVAAAAVSYLLEKRRREAVGARQQAEADRARAEDVMGFMVVDLRESVEPTGRLSVLEEIGRKAREYYEKLPEDGVTPASLRRHAITLRQLGDVYRDLGNLSEAREAYGLSAEVAGRILTLSPEDRVGRYHQSLGRAREALTLLEQGYSVDAEKGLRAHHDAVLRLLESHPDEPEYLDALARAHVSLTLVARMHGRWDDAEQGLQQALDIYRRLEANRPDNDEWTRSRLLYQRDRAYLLGMLDRHEEALDVARSTLDEVLSNLRNERNALDVRWRELEGGAQQTLARAQRLLDGGGLDQLRLALAAYRRLHATSPENDRWRAAIAYLLFSLGDHHGRRHEHPKAMVFTTEAYDILRDLTGKDPTNARWQNLLVMFCDRMAMHVRNVGGTVEQRRAYRLTAENHGRNLVELEPSNPKWQMIHAYTLVRLGESYVADDHARARQALARGTEIAHELLQQSPASHELAVLLWSARCGLAGLDEGAGRREEAVKQYRLGLEDLLTCWEERPLNPEVTVQIGNAYGNLARSLSEGSEAERAEAAQVLETGLDFVTRRVYEDGGWTADMAEAPLLVRQVEGLEAQRKALTEDAEAPK